MNKKQWQEYHGFYDDDMALIEIALSYGRMITAVFDRPLGYDIIKYS